MIPLSIYSQSKSPQEQTQPAKTPVKKNEPVKRFIIGTVILQSDSTKMPVKSVVISIMQDSLHLKTKTDSLGRFKIDITKQYDKLPQSIILLVSHPDYPSQSVRTNKNNLHAINITVREAKIIGVATSETQYFYASPTENPSDQKDTLKKRKWWQFGK